MDNSLPSEDELASLYLSLTDYCNLECDYCSADAGPDKDHYLDEDLALQAVTQWLQDLKLPAARLVFTGGEAVFWGYDKLDRLCQRARELAAQRQIALHIGIQSNGTVATAKFIDFCQRWHVEPSFSLDGTPNLSNVHRGQGDKVFRNLKRLQELNVRFALIICLTREVADNIDAVLDFLEEHRFLKVRINILGVPPGERTRDSITAADIFHVKRTLYERRTLNEYNVSRQVLWFDQSLAGAEPGKGHCENERCQAGQKTAVVNPDGRWGMCVEKSMTDGLPVFPSKQAMADGARAFWQAQPSWSGCTGCPARSICDHGCIAYHKGDHAVFEEECHATQQFWKYLVRVRLLHQEFVPTVPAAARRQGRLLQPLLPLK